MLHLDALERQVHTAVMAGVTMRAAGAEKADIPEWSKVRDQFDADLAAVPVEQQTDQNTVMLRALGLR